MKQYYLNDFTVVLHRHFEEKIDYLLANEPISRKDARGIFDSFLNRIHLDSDKIIRYTALTEKERSSPLRVAYFKKNLRFVLKINKFLDAEFSLVIEKHRIVRLDKDLILTKIKPIVGYVYFIYSQYGYKIGYTTNIKNRLNTFNVKLPFDVTLHSHIETTGYKDLESFLHSVLISKRLNGEWFDLTDDDFIDIDKLIANKGLVRTNNL